MKLFGKIRRVITLMVVLLLILFICLVILLKVEKIRESKSVRPVKLCLNSQKENIQVERTCGGTVFRLVEFN